MTRYGMAIDLRRCAGCGACVVACQMQNNQRPGVSWNNLDVYEWGTQAGESGRAYVPNACVQCEKPACVDACPTGASVRRDDGITVIDYEKCIACGLCLAACPYGARKLNRTSENMFGADVPAPYESYGVQRELVAEKCIFCEARLAEGKQTTRRARCRSSSPATRRCCAWTRLRSTTARSMACRLTCCRPTRWPRRRREGRGIL